jgi:2-polyprenyl-3-methyl-5-hydroxy-6-metoxy-1,4-benzoquinol methylase
VSVDPHSDSRIVESWHTNAAPWTEAVRNATIESRALVTDRAITDAVLSRAPRSALDIGCGEGWLVRALTRQGVRAIGVDIVPALIEDATSAGEGEFRVASYESIAAGELDVEVDVAIANFSLIGRESVEGVLCRVPEMLATGGALIVQTLHPVIACGDLPYEDGWRAGSWAGCGAGFSDPAPWYFRTIESWVSLFVRSGLRIVAMTEPLHPASRKPVSLIIVADSSC